MRKLNLDIQMFASTNKTTNYELPQFVGTDKPTWLGDFNSAMLAIDTGMATNAGDIDDLESDVATASSTASQASSDVATLTSTVNTLSGNVSTVTTTANNASSTATSALNTANTANGKADTNASAISDLNTAVTALQTAVGGLGGTVLWENQSPTSDFAGNTSVTLSSSDYDYLIWLYAYNTASSTVEQSAICTKGKSAMFNVIGYSTGQSGRRRADYVDATHYTITSAYYGSTQNSNSYCIPLACIGCKLGE